MYFGAYMDQPLYLTETSRHLTVSKSVTLVDYVVRDLRGLPAHLCRMKSDNIGLVIAELSLATGGTIKRLVLQDCNELLRER